MPFITKLLDIGSKNPKYLNFKPSLMSSSCYWLNPKQVDNYAVFHYTFIHARTESQNESFSFCNGMQQQQENDFIYKKSIIFY